MSIITTEALSRSYGHRVGIETVDLKIAEGEICGFLGPNGAGKTTTIRLLLGFLRPTSGQARVCGLDCWQHSRRIKREVGYLPGDLRLYPWMNGHTALKICGQVRGTDLRPVGTQLADRFQLELGLRVKEMSRGMRQKLGIILALAHMPRLLILDEPTSALDPLMQIELASCLRELATAGHTVFFSSHTLSEVESLCDRVAIIRRGSIIVDEQLQTLRARARRIVELLIPNGATADSIQPPGFLRLIQRDRQKLVFELEGATAPLVRWAAEQQFDDISISSPDLESLFHRLYQSQPESS